MDINEQIKRIQVNFNNTVLPNLSPKSMRTLDKMSAAAQELIKLMNSETYQKLTTVFSTREIVNIAFNSPNPQLYNLNLEMAISVKKLLKKLEQQNIRSNSIEVPDSIYDQVQQVSERIQPFIPILSQSGAIVDNDIANLQLPETSVKKKPSAYETVQLLFSILGLLIALYTIYSSNSDHTEVMEKLNSQSITQQHQLQINIDDLEIEKQQLQTAKDALESEKQQLQIDKDTLETENQQTKEIIDLKNRVEILLQAIEPLIPDDPETAE